MTGIRWPATATVAATSTPVAASARVMLHQCSQNRFASAASASLLARETGSAQPLLDSLTTWGSVYATWLVARKRLDTWPWWLAVDALIAVLCWRQQLFASMILYILYLGLVVVGWRSWHLDLKRHQGSAA